MNLRLLFLALVSVAAVVPLFGQLSPPPPKHLGPFSPPLTAGDREKLIAWLGSDDPAERAQALRRLAQAPEATDLLRQTVEKDRNPQVRAGATKALAAVAGKLARKRLDRLADYAKNRQVDRFVEAMAYWRETLTNEDRYAPRKLAEAILDRCRTEFKAEVPKIEFWPIWHSHGLTTGSRLTYPHSGDIVAESVEYRASHRLGLGFGVVRDASSLGGGTDGMCFVNGDLSIENGIIGGLVVCNGNMKITAPTIINYVVVICTEDLSSATWTNKCLFITGGEIKIDKDWIQENARLRPKEKKLGELIALYDCREGGLEVAVAEKQVRVTAVDAGKPFGKAGLRAGDVIESIDGLPVPDARTLNKLLCRAAVGATGEAALRIRRGGQALDLTVPVPD
jgi:hypothetical protein